MFEISKEFHFSASHVLERLPESHPCSRLHGHNYETVFFFESERLNEVGFIIDYTELKTIKKFIDTNLDHRHLNDVMDVNPTAENIAKYLFDKFKPNYPQLSKVVVKETPKTMASYAAKG